MYLGRVDAGAHGNRSDVSLDLGRETNDQHHKAAIIVSQDWDIESAVRLAQEIAHAQGHRLVFDSATPVVPWSLLR